MLPNKLVKILSASSFKALILGLFSLCSLNPLLAFAADPNAPDVATMLVNFAQTVPTLMMMVTSITYVMGMFLIFKGIMGLKQYGEQRTQMSSSHSLKEPLILMIIGTALLYLPSSVATGFNTFWTDGSPLAYIPPSTDQYSVIYQDAYMVIELIGTIAFIRGLLTLSHLGGQAQHDTVSKGLAFVISGILCINLYSFLQVLGATLGITIG